MALQKHIMEHVQIAAGEQAMVAMQQQQVPPEQAELAMESMKAQFVAEGMQQLKQLSQQVSGQGPDPLVQLKEKELEIKAQSEQADAEVDKAKLQLDAQNQQMRASQFQQKLSSTERQTQARIDSAMQKEIMKQQGK
jgi:hypothetical protein